MERTEELIIRQLIDGKNEAYRYLFDNYYPLLCHIASQYVQDDFLAETIVGDVIFHLWEVRQSLHIELSLRSYLIRSVRNRCLNYLKSQSVQREQAASSLADLSSVSRYLYSDDYPLGRLLEKELEREIAQAIERLPESSKRVFKLSRFEGKRYEEIAQELGISINTVKYHIKQALASLSGDLRKYLVVTLVLYMQG